MSAVLHVRCPIKGCPAVVDSVIEKETWGSTIPGDHGCGNVTLNDSAMINHIASAHSAEDVLRALADYHQTMVNVHATSLAGLRERFSDAVA